jgi:hypothetical protein
VFMARMRRNAERSIRFKTLLPSRHAGLQFSADLTVRWHRTENSDRITAKKKQTSILPKIRLSVREKASKVTRECCLTDHYAASDAILAALGSDQSVDKLSTVNWRVTRASLTVNKGDHIKASEQHVALSEEHARINRSQERLQSMQAVMADPATLCAWRLQHTPLTKPPTESTITELTKVSRTIASLPPTSGSRSSAEWLAQFAGWAREELGPSQREQMLDSIANLIQLFGNRELSDRITAVRTNVAQTDSGDNACAATHVSHDNSTINQHL